MTWPPNPGEIWVAESSWDSQSGPAVRAGDALMVIETKKFDNHGGMALRVVVHSTVRPIVAGPKDLRQITA